MPKRPFGTKQRVAPGDWERATNRQQRRLIRAYNDWSVETRRRLSKSALRGATAAEQARILERQLPVLESKLIEIVTKGTISATRMAAGDKFDTPVVQTEIAKSIRENVTLVKEALIPKVGEKLLPQVVKGMTLAPRDFLGSFNTIKPAMAAYAGGFWVMIFTVQKTLGHQREVERAGRGEPIEPVRWVLDKNAEHCKPSPGYYGCPELAGEYKSWNNLPTVPAGKVSCRGNCRCRLEVKRDGRWQRGLE